jgi:signal transduction histidine kinase
MAIWRRWSAYLRARPLLADGLFALALFTITNSLVGAVPAEGAPRHMGAWLALSAACLSTVVIRRRWPWLAIATLAVLTTAGAAVGLPIESMALLVITYTAAATLPVRQSAAAALLMWAPPIVATVAHGGVIEDLDLGVTVFVIINVMTAAVAYLVGRIVFTRRRYVAALVERARTAEQNQRALAAQAVEEERRRIARELHDMVAHHVSVMGVLATGSRRMLHKDLAAADEALATIEATGRTALREMRRLLDVLRTDPEPVEELAPQPGMAGLVGLVEQVREAGLAVTLHADLADPLTVDTAVGLTVYRVVQEALTNVLKHGGPGASAEVRIGTEDEWLTLEVYDTGTGPVRPADPDAIGHGLVGMQERIALFGGTLRTGPRPGGGFRVYARIPTDAR